MWFEKTKTTVSNLPEGGGWHPYDERHYAALWNGMVQRILESGVPPCEVLQFVADTPTFRERCQKGRKEFFG